MDSVLHQRWADSHRSIHGAYGPQMLTSIYHISDDRYACVGRTNTLLTCQESRNHIKGWGDSHLWNHTMHSWPEIKTSPLCCISTWFRWSIKGDPSAFRLKHTMKWHRRQQTLGYPSLSQCECVLAVLRSVDGAQSQISKSQHGHHASRLAPLQRRFADDLKAVFWKRVCVLRVQQHASSTASCCSTLKHRNSHSVRWIVKYIICIPTLWAGFSCSGGHRSWDSTIDSLSTESPLSY